MKYFDHDIRIRYAETDQMGVCYYANYFTWFEIGRTEYFRALGLPYTHYEKRGILLPVGKAYCRYHKPIRYDDCITIRTWITHLKKASIRFAYSIRFKNSDQTVAQGYTTHIFADSSLKPCAIPDDIRDRVELHSEKS